MSYGISTITNANDEVIIDAKHVPLRIVGEGSVSLSNGEYLIPIPGGLSVDPIVFIAWPIGNAILVNGGISAGTYKVTAISDGPSSLSYWVCALEPSPGTGLGYGMAIYDESGTVTFSTGAKHMRMKGLIDATGTGQVIESNGPFTHISTPSLYPVTVPRVRVIGEIPPAQFPDHGAWVIAGGRRVSATSFEFIDVQSVAKNSIGEIGYPLGGSEFILLGSVI